MHVRYKNLQRSSLMKLGAGPFQQGSVTLLIPTILVMRIYNPLLWQSAEAGVGDRNFPENVPTGWLI